MSYPRLSIEDFGRNLLETGDLDPLYIALANGFPIGQGIAKDQLALNRFLVAYWCLYHVGSAAWIAEHEGDEFWEKLMDSALQRTVPVVGGRWQRGHERRHFRGAQGEAAVKALRSKYEKPEHMVSYLAGGEDVQSFKAVSERVQEHRGFGPWMAFKVCDMLEVLGMASVDFDEAAVFMFKDPARAAEMVFRAKTGTPADQEIPRDQAINFSVSFLENVFKSFKAPPVFDRAIGLQEVETVLCKWKSHMNGHYPLNNDIHEINSGLEPWVPHSPIAAKIRANMPSGERQWSALES